MSSKERITIVVPAFNEQDNLIDTYTTIKSVFRNCNVHEQSEIMIVNDASTDNTGAIADELSVKDSQVKVVHNKMNLGIGTSFTNAVMQAKGDKILIVPGDNDMTPDLLHCLLVCSPYADIVSCVFLNPEIRGVKRHLLSTLFSTIYTLTFGVFKGYLNSPCVFRVDMLRKIRLVSKRFSINAEINIKLLRMGASFTEVVGYRKRGMENSRSLSFRSLWEVVSVYLSLIGEIYFTDKSKYQGTPERVIIPFSVDVEKLGAH